MNRPNSTLKACLEEPLCGRLGTPADGRGHRRRLSPPRCGEKPGSNPRGEQGLVYFAAASGSTGSGVLMNHHGAGAGLVRQSLTIPDSLGPIVETELGPPPEPGQDGASVALVARAVDAVLRIGLDLADADVLAAWLTEPDGTAHEYLKSN